MIKKLLILWSPKSFRQLTLPLISSVVLALLSVGSKLLRDKLHVPILLPDRQKLKM